VRRWEAVADTERAGRLQQNIARELLSQSDDQLHVLYDERSPIATTTGGKAHVARANTKNPAHRILTTSAAESSILPADFEPYSRPDRV
jgi:hypothetical protein